MTESNRRRLRLASLVFVSLALAGCGLLWNDTAAMRRHHASSTLVDFLYQNDAAPASDETPQLRLPLRVGLSFLPTDPALNDAPSAADREKVLEAVRERFRTLPYVTEIVIVPDYYLHTGRADGLMQLQQLSKLYKLDLFALVSYDQVVETSLNAASLSYFTIVGAYVMQGDRHDTHTLVDLAVIHPDTRALVLRSAGTSRVSGTATMVDSEGKALRLRRRGLELASEQLIANFGRELEGFEARVRAGTGPVRVSGGGKTGGTGDIDALLLAALLATLGWKHVRSRMTRAREAPLMSGVRACRGK